MRRVSSSMSEGGPPAEASGEADAPFRSACVQQRVRQHYLWHGDLLADVDSFATFRLWLEERLPRVTQTAEGYFTAALVRRPREATGGFPPPHPLRPRPR